MKAHKTNQLCFLCGASDWIPLFWAHDRIFPIAGKFHIMRCASCGIVGIVPALVDTIIRKHYKTDEYYTNTRQTGENIIFTIRRLLIIHSTSRSIIGGALRYIFPLPAIPSRRQNSRILDIGCGNGQTLKVLDDLGWDTYGIDIDPRAVDIARSKGLHHVVQGSYTKLTSYPDNFFDTIRLYHVIEHLDRPDTCVRLVYAKLKKGGELLIGTPNIDSLIGRLGGTYWFNLDTPRHLYLFSPQTLHCLLEKYGFRIKGLQYGSGGGIIGTIEYYLSDIVKKKVNLIGHHWLMILLYPVDWILDRMHVGDVFTMTATK